MVNCPPRTPKKYVQEPVRSTPRMAVQSALVVLVRASLRGSDQMVRPAALSWCPLPYSCKRYTYMSCNVPATRTARHRYFLRFQRFPTLFQLFPSKKQGSNAKPPKRCPSAAQYRLNTRNLGQRFGSAWRGGKRAQKGGATLPAYPYA